MKLANYFLFTLLLPGVVAAQPTEKNKEVEQIIITKKGASDEKLNITLDGNNVIVNGKPIDNNKEADITVKRMKIKNLDDYRDFSANFPQNGTVRGMLLQPGATTSPNKAMLGVATEKADDAPGVVVKNVAEESAAQKAGLKEGDLIVEVDSKKIDSPDDLSKAIGQKNPGDKVTIWYLRDKKQNTAVAELTKWKAPEAIRLEGMMPGIDIGTLLKPRVVEGFRLDPDGRTPQSLPLRVSPATPKLGIKIQDLEAGEGVKILEVEKGSDADKAGLKAGDIIKEANGSPINDTDTMAGRLRQQRGTTPLKLKIERQGKAQNIEIRFSKKIKTAEL